MSRSPLFKFGTIRPAQVLEGRYRALQKKTVSFPGDNQIPCLALSHRHWAAMAAIGRQKVVGQPTAFDLGPVMFSFVSTGASYLR